MSLRPAWVTVNSSLKARDLTRHGGEHISLIPALGRKRPMDLSVSSRIARAVTQKNSVLKTQKTKT